MNPTDDRDDLSRLFHDAVSDVEPRPGLGGIRARTGATRPRRAWVWGAGAAVVATAATIAAVAVLGGGVGTTAPGPGPAAGPTSTGPDQQPTTAQSPAAATLRVYFVGDTGAGPRLFRELHTEPEGRLSLDVAVEEAVTGAAQDPDYRTLWPEGTRLERAQLSDGVLSVDLSGPVAERPPGITSEEAELALQQVVRTAQSAVQQVIPVTFLIDGRPARTVLGVATEGPVARTSDDDVLAAVSVSAPADGATVDSPFTVDGAAAAFEANVPWELMQGRRIVRSGFTTAAECCTLSPYSFTVQAPPGDYTLVVHDDDPSDGEGNPPSQDTKRITVR